MMSPIKYLALPSACPCDTLYHSLLTSLAALTAFLLFCLFETGSCYGAQASFKLSTLPALGSRAEITGMSPRV